MARSAALMQCSFGGTNFHLMCWEQRYLVIADDASLSKTLNCGLNPMRSKKENTSSKAAMIVGALRSVMALTMIALVVCHMQ